MKVLITGSTGFVGKNLTEYLKDRYKIVPITSKDCNLLDSTNVKNTINDINPDVIIHLAAKADPNPNINDPYNMAYENVEMTKNLCRYSKTNCKMIFISSLVIYGNTPHKIEEHEPLKPISAYGLSKKYCEDIIRLTKPNYTILRPCAIVGQYLTHGAIFDFINKLKSDSKKLELFGNCPGSVKPYLHINDLIKAIDILININKNIKINITPDNSISIDEVSDQVMGALSIHKEKKWLGSKSVWAGDNNILQGSNQLMKDLNINLEYDSLSAVYKTARNYI